MRILQSNHFHHLDSIVQSNGKNENSLLRLSQDVEKRSEETLYDYKIPIRKSYVTKMQQATIDEYLIYRARKF